MKDIQKQIERLRDEIRRHDVLYYVHNAPEITDRGTYNRYYDYIVHDPPRHLIGFFNYKKPVVFVKYNQFSLSIYDAHPILKKILNFSNEYHQYAT